MDKPTFAKLTKFAQDIVDSTPREELEDEWFEFSNEIDVNIWWEEGEPIRATSYPILITSDGYATTNIDQIYCNIPIKENRYVA